MDINKALRRESRRNRRTYIMMGILAIILPGSLWATQVKNSFFIGYVIIMELLIFLVVLKRIDRYKIDYVYSNNKLTFKSGIFNKKNLILCDQVVTVHTENIEEDMIIILISTVKFRNSRFKPVVEGLLKKYPNMKDEYIKAKNINPDKKYFYLMIKKGGLKKYNILGDIFNYCVKANYTAEAIQNIKIARGQILD